MALHPDITRKDDVSLALGMAADALLLASTQQTGNAGSVTIPNADGSKTVMGVDAGDTTVARFVGRVTPPNRPTGITAESHMSTLFVAWDGTLEGGVDAAFLFTRITITYTDADGDHSVDLGDLRGKGSVGSTTLPVGTVVTVTARAYDDAHDDTGRSMPNVSAPSDPITVTIVDEAAQLEADVTADIKVVSDKADKAQGVADDAADANTKLREDTAKSLETVNTAVSGVRTDVDAVSKKATTLASGLDSANTKITSTSDKLTGLTTTVSNVSKTADDSMALSTTNHQDLAGFQTKVQQTYSTKEETLSQVSAVSQKADSISASLSKDYQKKTDADATYATKTALQATADGITASVSETYATKSVVEALQNIADNAIETWQGHGVPSMTGKPTSDWTTVELRKQHSGDMYYDLDTGYSYRFGSADGSTYTWDKISDSDITRAMQAAADAQSDADKANAGVSKLNTDIPATYATKSDVKITTDGIKTDVSKAMTLGQTGIDNAATVSQKADGIQATVTQQAQTLSDNVKAIAQVNMRADSLNTSITQVSNKTDMALANSQELVIDGGFEHGFDNWEHANDNVAIDNDGAHSGSNYLRFNQMAAGQTSSIIAKTNVQVIPGRTYRFGVWAYAQGPQLVVLCRIVDGKFITIGKTTLTTMNTWTFVSFDWTADVDRFKPAMWFESNYDWQRYDDFTITDVTGVKAAQQSADAASSKADTAIIQSSQLSQDLSGFKTSVGQTYETKTDSTAKSTALQQNLDGFKTSVASTYASKSDVADTYATKSDVTQTSDSLTSQISAVGNTANSALNKDTTNQQNLDGFKTSVSSTYATKQALGDTDGKAVKAGNNANLALANAQELLADPTFIQKWDKWVNLNAANASVWFDTNNGNLMLDPNANVSRWAMLVTTSNLSGTTPVGHDRTYRISCDARAPWGGTDTIFYVSPANGMNLQIPTSGLSKTDYTHFEMDITLKANRVLDADTLIGISTPGDTGIAVRNVHVRDITEVAQLQSDVAATYATQSSVQTTATQITSQVETKYATKDDVTSKYTTLQQTDSAFDARIGTAQSTAANAQSNAANAQNRAGVLETLIHSDANGVRVGKTVNGLYTGYSALVNANGSFDVLNPAGQMVSRFNSDGIQMPSGLVSVNGIPMVEDITDKLVFLNSYWDYRISATRLFNMVTMQIWLRRCGDPNGDFVQNAWVQSWLFKIKKGWRPHGEPGNQNGQDIHFPATTNAVFTKAFSNIVFFQVTDTYIAVRSSMDGVKYVNGSLSDPSTGSWVSGTVSWMIDPDHQTTNDDSPVKN